MGHPRQRVEDGRVARCAEGSGVRVERAIGSASKAIQGTVRSEGAATRQALDGGFSRVEAGMESGFRQVGEGLERIDASLDRVEETLQTGFMRLHFDLEDVQASLTEMSAKFDYGFAQLSTQSGRSTTPWPN